MPLWESVILFYFQTQPTQPARLFSSFCSKQNRVRGIISHADLNMEEALKKLIIAMLTCICTALTMSGCDALSFSVGNLLSAPSIADEQAAIHQALIDSVGQSVTPAYPRSGDYRSAFIITDLDADGEDEALAFYTISSQTSDQVVRVSVLDMDESGRWYAMYELAGSGNYIDSVFLADYDEAVDIIIGFGAQAYEDKKVCIYRYTGGTLSAIYKGTYSELLRLDLDGCGADETVIVKKTGTSASVNVIKTLDGLDYATKERTLSVSASQIAGCRFGRLWGDVNALFIDAVNENSIAFTEVVWLDDEGIVCPTSDNQNLMFSTGRPSDYLSADYDGDGVIEIPVISPFLGYSALTMQNLEYVTRWLSYDGEARDFVVEAESYFSLSGGFVFKLPSRWQNFVTVKTNPDTNEVTFLKYDYTASGLDSMEMLLSIAAIDPQNKRLYENNGYEAVMENDFVIYMIKSIADESEPLLLTQDEITSNLYYISP